MGKNHHRHKDKRSVSNNLLKSLKWFLIWTIIYGLLYIIFNFLLKEMLGTFPFYQVKFISILILGLCFSISARIIHSLIHKKHIYLGTDVFIFWTLAYGLSIWFFEFLKDLFIDKLNLTILSNVWLGFMFIAIGIFFSIKIIKRIEFGISRPKIRAPSQIVSGILLLVAGILTFRFSTIIFLNWLKWGEGLAWSWLLGLGLIIAGILVLVAWWRNNVLQHRIGIKFGRW
ncbi:MAG: hypothetical protein PHD81_01725 [Candidatus Nanoarchaeia archaeon]|nr:hypothetical protein [Candidatus Nanoarchaeia archaeon]MDD5587808.1 hypothetical protein [Candidatus Nanoarchaeia archaeon]